MTRSHDGLVLLLSLLLAACAASRSSRGASEAPSVVAEDAALARRIDETLDAALRERRVVGAVVLVARDGRLVYGRAAGLADRERGVAMREDTLFRYASVTKPFVAAAALSLVERGALRLDDPITRFLPDFRPRLEDGTAPAITVRQLLTHTSGLGYSHTEPEDGPYHRAGVSDGLDAPGRSFEDNARRLVSVPLRARPGTAFRYSLSTDVLGEVVARASGSPLPEAVARLVAAPLGLRDAGFTVTDPSRLAAAYADGRDGPVRMEDGHRVPFAASAAVFAPSRAFDRRSYPSGGAGMVGTAHDLLTFLEALRRGDARLLSPESARRAMQDQLGDADTSELGEGMGFGFVGAVVVDPARARSAARPGTVRWGGIYGHTWFIDPVEKLTVVLMTNTTLEGMSGRLSTELERAVYGR